MRPLEAIARTAAAALDLLAPPVCLACGVEESSQHGLGDACLRLLPPAPSAPCSRCAAPRGPGSDGEGRAACCRPRVRFECAVAAGPYAGFLGELVRRAKYGNDPVLAVPLRGLLVEAVAEWPARQGVSVVVPVPGTRSRVRERGFHLAELLADAVATALDVPLRDSWLARVGEPEPQAALPRSRRRLAARDTVSLREPRFPWERRPRLAGATALLVDDVLTTGATADACARVLLAAGASEVRVAVVARA